VVTDQEKTIGLERALRGNPRCPPVELILLVAAYVSDPVKKWLLGVERDSIQFFGDTE